MHLDRIPLRGIMLILLGNGDNLNRGSVLDEFNEGIKKRCGSFHGCVDGYRSGYCVRWWWR